MLLDYRKDIDGLRAIAVLLVIFYHMGFAVSGGFVGVDIFFVISGFLIASLIQKQILRDKFSFKGFYLHRMRRILPTLIFVVVSTFIVGWFFVMSEDLNYFCKTIIYSLFGFSNIYFYNDGISYFSSNADSNLLLHTWSLGVEEQFYLIAPIFLLVLFKYTYKTKWFNFILVATFISGLLISHYYAVNNQLGAYFLLPARFFELLMGVILALNYSKLPVVKNTLVNNLLAVLALILIFVPAFVITKEDIFPSYNAFLVCLGACLVIYLGKAENKTFLTKFISIKPVVFIGLISYSLYLWHWPVASYIATINIEISILYKIIIILVLIALSTFTYKFVEQPFRHKFKWSFFKTFLLLLFIPALIAQGVKMASKETKGFYEYRLDNIKEISSTLMKNARSEKSLCHSDIRKDKNPLAEHCYIGDKNARKTVLMYGDSHANSFAPFISQMLKQVGRRGDIITVNSSLYLTSWDTTGLEYSYLSNKDLVKYFNLVEKSIKENNYDYVVISGFYDSYVNPKVSHPLTVDEIVLKISDTLDLIKSTGAEPIFVKDLVTLEKGDEICELYNRLLNLGNNCNQPLSNFTKERANVEPIYQALALKYPDLIMINPLDVMCDDKECKTYIDDTALYFDSHHLTAPGSKLLGDIYLQTHKNPFKPE